MKDTVVVYYSRTGKTRFLAERLAALLEADLEEIVDRKDRSGALGWLSGGKDATLKRASEIASAHVVEGRRTVILGMPVWAFGPPPAVRGYLARHDLTGKRVCAFCTYDGSGEERTFAALSRLLPGGLAATLGFKKPSPDDPQCLARLKEWADRLRA